MSKQLITACVFLYDEEHRVLLARRAATKRFLPNKLELPGGHIEFGETIEEGLRRELREELHIEIQLDRPFHAFTYLRDEGTTHSVEVDYFAQLVGPKEAIRLNPEDHSNILWLSEDEIDTYLDQSDEETKAIHAGFDLLKRARP